MKHALFIVQGPRFQEYILHYAYGDFYRTWFRSSASSALDSVRW